MDKNEQDGHNDADDAAGSYAKYSGIAFQMIAVIGVFTFIGYEIDKYLKHDLQWVTAFASLTGVCFSIFLTIKQLKR